MTRARARKSPGRDHKFSRSFRFQGVVETTRAPWVLMFSVRASRAGWRTSRLQRSTLTDREVRFSNRRAIACMRHPGLAPHREDGYRGGKDSPIIRRPGSEANTLSDGVMGTTGCDRREVALRS